MKKIALLFFGFAMLASAGQAQKLKQTGDLKFLKGESPVNVEYRYDNMMVGKKTEDQYVKDSKADREKKDMGSGEKWLDAWRGNRETRFQPKFEELLNKSVKGVSFGHYPDAKYTMIVHTTWTEPGYNIGVSKMPAYINATVSFVETGKDAQLGQVTITKAPGSQYGGYDFDAGTRLSEAYAISGKRLGAWLMKNAYK
jgi:hypothetical protein